MKKHLSWLIITLLFASQVNAQLEDRFGYLLEKDLSAYAQPLATSLGVAFNSGGYHDASVSKLFGFSIGVKGMFIFIPDNQKTFTPQGLPAGYNATEETATIYGNKGAAYSGPLGYLTYPPGLDRSWVPAAFPQATVSVLGTELLVRYLPTIKVGDEELDLFGFGIKHSVSQYIPLLPVDIAVQFLYNKLTITNLLDVKNTAFNIHASKSLGVLLVYGGLQYESTSVDFTYKFTDPNGISPGQKNQEITLSLNGENSFRVTVGAALKLAFFVLNADYSVGSQGVFTTGFSFEF